MAKPKTKKTLPWPLLVITFTISLVIGTQLGLLGQMLLNQDRVEVKTIGERDKIKRRRQEATNSKQSSCIQPADGGPALNENFEPCTN